MNELKQFAPDIWIADGPLVRDMGLMFTTRMTIVRLTSGDLWISSPVPASPETIKAITGLGPVRYLIAATPRHVWRLADWHSLFPEAQLWVARTTAFTLKKGPLPVTGVLTDEAPQAWAGDMQQLVFQGNPGLSEVLFFHERARTVLLDDLIQSDPVIPGMPFRNLMFKLEGVLAPQAGVGLDMRWTFTKRDLARWSLEKLLSWDFDKLIIAHGDCIEKDAKAYVKQAFRWLSR